jgi:hypothetical protein
MNHKYDWDAFPKYTLDIGLLYQPAEIQTLFRSNNIDKYVYCIMFKGIVIKFGMSAARSHSRLWGERVYRQIGHCSSWPNNVRLSGSSGSDWLQTEIDFQNLLGIKIDHSYLKLIVWDVTNYDFKSTTPFKEVESMESELINIYLKQFGEKPIGNIHDEANKLNRDLVSKAVVDSLFTIY